MKFYTLFIIILPPLNFPKMFFSFLCSLDLLTIELPIYVVSDWEEKKILSEMWLLPSEEFQSEFLIKLKQMIPTRAHMFTMIVTKKTCTMIDIQKCHNRTHQKKREFLIKME